jgi:hypothetical protein
MAVEIIKKVFCFVYDDVIVAQDKHFDEWCAFADNELEAQLKIQSRYNLGGRRLKLVGTLDDRRKSSRRGDDRRAA